MNIRLHIERIVLDGLPVDRTQSGRLRAAVVSELTRLLATGGLGRECISGGAVPSVRGGDLRVEKGSGASEVGKQIARSVHAGIGRAR